MKLNIPVILVTLILGIGCNEIDLPKGAPTCLKEKIKDFRKELDCKEIKVNEYVFQAKTVFLFENKCCCDQTSNVLDDACHFIGALGGIAGNSKINGEEFSGAVFTRTIWEEK